MCDVTGDSPIVIFFRQIDYDRRESFVTPMVEFSIRRESSLATHPLQFSNSVREKLWLDMVTCTKNVDSISANENCSKGFFLEYPLGPGLELPWVKISRSQMYAT